MTWILIFFFFLCTCYVFRWIKQVITESVAVREDTGRDSLSWYYWMTFTWLIKMSYLYSCYFSHKKSTNLTQKKLRWMSAYQPFHVSSSLFRRRGPLPSSVNASQQVFKKKKKRGTNKAQHCFIVWRINHLWRSFVICELRIFSRPQSWRLDPLWSSRGAAHCGRSEQPLQSASGYLSSQRLVFSRALQNDNAQGETMKREIRKPSTN